MAKPTPSAPPAAPGNLAALSAVPDPRHPYGRPPGADPIPLVPLRQLVVAALLEQWGLLPGRSPCVATLRRVLKALEVVTCRNLALALLRRAGYPGMVAAVALVTSTSCQVVK